MDKRYIFGTALAGACAGAVTGLFGAGGGMVLIPLLRLLTNLEEAEYFPFSISVILPLCLIILISDANSQPLPWAMALPYLIGSGIGGTMAGLWENRIPVQWLHWLLGGLILWGGLRYLC